jgi:AraC-like DNA-binding protein
MNQQYREGDNFFAYFDGSEVLGTSLYITTVGKVSIGSYETYPYKPEKHPEKYSLSTWEQGRSLNEFQFLYISEGGGRLRSFEGEFTLRPGNLIVLVPGEKHRYIPDPETGWTEYWIGFSGTTPEEWIKQELLDGAITIHPILNQTEMRLPFEEALSFVQNGSHALQALIASCVMRIFACLMEEQYERLSRINYDIIEQAKSIFKKTVFHPMDMEQLTKILNVNYQHLRDQFREKTGLSPYQYFLQMKINKAKELLQEGSLSIKEISYKLSFDSPYYFSRLFKKKTGISPSLWSNTTSTKDLDLWDG